MGNLHVTYDTESGRIIGIHQGAADAKSAQHSALSFAKTHSKSHTKDHTPLSATHIAVITVPADALERKKLYKVDVGRKVLMAAAPGEGGSGGGFGVSGGAS